MSLINGEEADFDMSQLCQEKRRVEAFWSNVKELYLSVYAVIEDLHCLCVTQSGMYGVCGDIQFS